MSLHLPRMPEITRPPDVPFSAKGLCRRRSVWGDDSWCDNRRGGALRRLLPVAYASEGLDGTGRDFARVLGVGAMDRQSLLVTLTAVLVRDPLAVAAVLAGLVRRRDDAARDLAFERAARLQAEIGAVKWSSPTRTWPCSNPWTSTSVAGPRACSSFEIRAGRLSRWTNRRCNGRTADALLAATPAHYRNFAGRNAALAVRLTAC